MTSVKAPCTVELGTICLQLVIASKSPGTKKLLPAGYGQRTQPAGLKVALYFPHLFEHRTYHVCKYYITSLLPYNYE